MAVGSDEAMPPAREMLDAHGLHVLPGAIDVHVHFREPGYPHKEDLATGTAAAAFGGVTTVFDMPNTIPPTGTADVLADKHRIAAAKAHVDFGLYGLLGEDTIEHVPALVEGGVIGFKLYMGNTFGNIPSPIDRRDAGGLRGRRPHRQAGLAARRDQFHHGAARDAHAQCRPPRSAGAPCRAARGGRGRGGEPRRHPCGMDRRAHPRSAYLVGRGAAAAARSQSARRRHHRRDLPAISLALRRRLCPPRRRHPGQSAGARSAQPRAALGGARRRHDRHDRDRPRARMRRRRRRATISGRSTAAFPASRRRCR